MGRDHGVFRDHGDESKTIALGIRELRAGGTPEGRVRVSGGGRNEGEKHAAEILPLLKTLMEDDVGGDPIEARFGLLGKGFIAYR